MMDEWMYGWQDCIVCKARWMDGWQDGIGCKARWMNLWKLYGWIVWWLDGYDCRTAYNLDRIWMNGWMNEWFGSKVFIHHNTWVLTKHIILHSHVALSQIISRGSQQAQRTCIHRWNLCLWYLYHMVAQNMLRKCEEKKVFGDINVKFATNIYINNCLKQIKLPNWIHTWTPISELPSYITIMPWQCSYFSIDLHVL